MAAGAPPPLRLLFFGVELVLAVWSWPAAACSRILFNKGCGRGETTCQVFSARTMDWATPFNDTLMYIPAGQRMDGGCGDAPSQKRWTSRYWSVTASINTWLSTQVSSATGEKFDFDRDGATDGVNEAGLAVHQLYLASTAYPEHEPAANAVTWPRWARYLLDTCATVSEARLAMRNVTVVGVTAGATKVPGAHMAVEDRSGDSAIFELVGGRLRVYPPEGSPRGAGLGRDYRVMANDPPLPAQLEHRDAFLAFGSQHPRGLKLKCNDTEGRDCATFTSSEACPSTCSWNRRTGSCQLASVNDCLPGDITSRARFTRLSYFLHFLEGAGTDPDTMAGYMRGVLLSAAVPHNAPDQDEWDDGAYPTWWYTVVDLAQGLYYFGWYGNLNTVYVDLDGPPRQAWSRERRVRYLDPRSKGLVGDVTHLFSARRPGPEADPRAGRLAARTGRVSEWSDSRGRQPGWRGALATTIACLAGSGAALALLLAVARRQRQASSLLGSAGGPLLRDGC